MGLGIMVGWLVSEKFYSFSVGTGDSMRRLMSYGMLSLLMFVSLPAISTIMHPPSGSYSVLGQPTVSAEFINRVLSANGSPATGTGQAVFDLGEKYGIDPVFALAFFQHESSFGTTGVARATRSPGNIRASAGYTQIDGYRAYRSWTSGFEDWYKLIKNLYIGQWNLTTVGQIVPVYAPSSDNNDVGAYISAVENAVDQWRSGIV